MKPIPKKLLIHEVTLKRYKKDTWGEDTLELEKTLKFVRIEPSKSRVLSVDNTEIQLNSLLFYDCVNSTPRGVIFELEDIITFEGTNYTVKTIDPLYGAKLHHYEIGLC